MLTVLAILPLLTMGASAPANAAAPAAKAERPPIGPSGQGRTTLVLDGQALRFRAPELSGGALSPRSVTVAGGKLLPLAPQSLNRLPDGWLVVTVPEGVREGTLALVRDGKVHTFAFRSQPAAPAAANPRWDAARRQECLAIAGFWAGRLSGNDPDVKATVSLELDADCSTVYGILNWRSATSGVNDRVLKGAWDAKARTLVAADVRLKNDEPVGGWRFCAIERYTLKVSEDGARLTGDYESRECRDRARVELARPEASAPPAPR